MTENSTVGDDVIAEEREQHAVILRVVADLHAAYGRGVNLDISAESFGPTVLSMTAGQGYSLAVAFWDDGEVFFTIQGVTRRPGTRVESLALIREFIHRHGKGAR